MFVNCITGNARRRQRNFDEVKKCAQSSKDTASPDSGAGNSFLKSADTARWAYNYFLDAYEQAYKEGRYINECEVRKYINNVLQKTTHTWLNEVGREGCCASTSKIYQ
ncbi:MAG: helix-turn-helix domain-containing protein [Desulfovibrionaceae bacterium]|nr:helix-turn-helix domain-containing protein [Desulfovibrionaceae bacterium]